MDQQFAQLESQYGLPVGMLSAVQQQESGGDSSAVSPKGAVGDFQIMPATAKQYGIDPTDPAQAAKGAAAMLGDLSKKYDGDVPSMLAAYNWGQGNLDKHGIENAPPETKNYIKKVSANIPDPSEDWEPVEASKNELPQNVDEWEPVDGGKAQSPLFSQDYSTKGILSQVGQSVKSGVQDIKDLANPDTWTGKNIGEGSPASQKLQNDAVQGNWWNMPRDVLGRMNEAMAGTPAGKILGAVGGITGAPLSPAVNAVSDAAEQGGIPKEATQFAMNTSPLFMKGMDSSRAAPVVDDPLAQKMLDMGAPLTQTDINGGRFSKTLNSMAKEIPGSGAAATDAAKQNWLNNVVAKTIGQPAATTLDSTVFNKAQDDTGAKYDSIVQGQTMNMQPQHLQKLSQIQLDANKFLKGDNATYVNGLVNNFFDEVNPNGTIAGETLADWRSHLSNALKGKPDGTTKYISDLRDTVMDMTTVNDPQKQALLQQANREWRNQKAIEPVVAKAQANNGNISPSLLRGAVGSNYNLAKGEGGDLGIIANGAYKYIRDPVANSGTVPRAIATQAVLEPIAAAAWASGTGDIIPLASSLGAIGGTVGAARLFNSRNANPTAVANLVKGKPNSYSFNGFHPANIAGISLNKSGQQNTDRNK